MYLSLLDILLATIAGLVLWLFWANLRAREIARRAVQKECRSHGVQLLDESVAGNHWRPTFKQGQPKILRRFVFDYTVDGSQRHNGYVLMNGNQVDAIWLSTIQLP